MSTIKEKILEMADPGEEVIPKEFDNLILDDVAITKFTQADKAYLEEFVNMDLLGLNHTTLNSLDNFPDSPKLVRLELNENFIKDNELAQLKHLTNLQTLKLANNQINDIAAIEHLKALVNLKNLDLASNPVTEVENYREIIFEALPSLEVLDCFNKEGQEVFSEEDDDDDPYSDEGYGDEEGSVPLPVGKKEDIEDDENDDSQEEANHVGKERTGGGPSKRPRTE